MNDITTIIEPKKRSLKQKKGENVILAKKRLVNNVDVYDKVDVELIEKVSQQLQFFDQATKDDFRKTLFLLSMYRAMNELIENYEFVLNEAKEEKLMLNEYDMSRAEGRGKRSMQRIWLVTLQPTQS